MDTEGAITVNLSVVDPTVMHKMEVKRLLGELERLTGARYAPEHTCKLIETEVEHPNGVKVRGAYCTACGHLHEGELGWFWFFCPHCGAKVVD